MRKKSMNKILTLTLAFAMTASLAACGGKDTAETTASASPKETTAVKGTDATEGSTAAVSQVPSEKNLYGFEDPVTLKIGLGIAADFEYPEGESATDNQWVTLYKENNINLDIIYQVDASQEGTKLATAITSGNYPDIIFTGGADYVNYARTGVTADITDLYEEYASDELKAYMESDGGVGLESAKVDGRLYGLPLLGNSYDSVMIMFIREDWLSRLGLDVPTTMEELHEVAYAFTHNDPDGNGADDTYGLALNGKDVFAYNSGIQAFFEGYGAIPGYWENVFTFIEKDGNVVWGGALADEMKAGLTLLKEMYADGSIAKDFGVMDNDRITEEMTAGKCGIMFAPMWGAMSPAGQLVQSNTDVHFAAAPIPDGMGEGSSKAYFTNSGSSYYTVSSKCENPEVLIKLMNLSVSKLCDMENTDFTRFYENSEWKCALTRTLAPLKNYDNYLKDQEALKTGDTSVLNAEQMGDYEKMKVYLDGMASGNPDVTDPDFQTGISLYTVFGDPQGGYAALEQIMKSGDLNVSAYNTIVTETMAAKFPTLNKLAMETIIKIITGDDISTYDAFLENWAKLGGDEVTAEAQSWYDVNMK